MELCSILKNYKQKLNPQSEGMFTMSMYTMSDEKNKLLLHCYEIQRDKMHLSGLKFQTDRAGKRVV